MRLQQAASALLVVVLAGLAYPGAAKSKKFAPEMPRLSHGSLKPETSSCADLPGTWIGFGPQGALNESYQLSWREYYPSGSFVAVYLSNPPTWTVGSGTMAADNLTCSMSFDNGVNVTGKVTDNCSTIIWDNLTSWRRTLSEPKTVYMVAMNHLDIGYNGIDPEVGLVNNVLNKYFTVHFPRAVAISNALRERNGTERLVYTTHSWLVDMYLNCPANFTLSGIPLACPSPSDAAAFAAALRAGDVAFHASPFNVQYGGVLNAEMLDALFQHPKRISAQLGLAAPIVASLRDVPGATRSVIPALARNGIKVLTLGVNNYAPRPQLPTPCVWVEPHTNASVVLLMTEQGQGYPNNVGPSPTDPQGLAAATCSSSPSSSAVLCWAFRTDNSGPPETVEEVLNQFEIARWQWPGANVVAATYEEWWAAFSPSVSSLPVTNLEMGETWLTAWSSDPIKSSFYRVSARAYASCLAAGQCDNSDPRIIAFLRYMIKHTEHTFGLPSIDDYANYTNVEFHAARASGEPTYTRVEDSWSEQRKILESYAMAALGDHPLAAQITAAAQQLLPVLPNPAANGFTPVSPTDGPFTVVSSAGNVTVGFDALTGAVNDLSLFGGPALADAMHLLGKFVYQTYNDTDLNSQHITLDNGTNPCCCCYGWSNMQKVANPQSSVTAASLTALWTSAASLTLTAPVTFLAELALPTYLHVMYGVPGAVWLNLTVTSAGGVLLEVQLFNKTATRLNEAMYADFATPLGADSVWLVDVLGEYVDPLGVVDRGCQHQHGVASGVYRLSPDGSGFMVGMLDLPVSCISMPSPTALTSRSCRIPTHQVVSPWTAVNPPTTLIVPLEPLSGPVEGISQVLFNNAFNTGFPFYSVDNAMKFRFSVEPLPPSQDRAERVRAATNARG